MEIAAGGAEVRRCDGMAVDDDWSRRDYPASGKDMYSDQPPDIGDGAQLI